MKYSFQHFIDIATSADTMQIINFNVGGEDVIKRCAHLFNAYKYFKLGKISVKFVPASTLPVDPLGLSYDDADPQTVDPRDQLNPGLVRITNGEDILDDVTGFTETQMQGIYEAMMLDPRWYKFSLQSGFKRTATPLYWQIGQLHQDQYPGTVTNFPYYNADGNVTTGNFNDKVSTLTANSGTGNRTILWQAHNSSEYGFFQTGHRGRLGYLPTDAYQRWMDGNTSAFVESPMVHPAPLIRTITAVLPKMHKTNYYYRCYITETVYFSGLRSIAPMSSSDMVFRGIDNFIIPPNVQAYSPQTNSAVYVDRVAGESDTVMNDGADE